MVKTVCILLVICVLVSVCGCQPVEKPETELRGVWVATTLNLDYPSESGLSAEKLRKEADDLLDRVKELGLNAVFLQVRPCGDALYPSEFYPWSATLSGKQGAAPDGAFDVLQYWVREAHQRGLELHAWINPFRVTQKEGELLSSDNPAVTHPEWTVKHTDGKLYLNPGIPDVREHIIGGVVEIVTNYDVDGIHFDDYFYPDETFPDEESFRKSGESDLLEWRRENINALIKETYDAVHTVKPDAVFGVSPFGIWQNLRSSLQGSATKGLESYTSHAADSRRWVKEEWLDYIAPQIYWHIGHDAADYETLVGWWSDVVRGTSVKLYVGHAGYRTLTAEEGSAWYGGEELARQLALNRKFPEVSGSIHFRLGCYLESPALMTVLKNQMIEITEVEEEHP